MEEQELKHIWKSSSDKEEIKMNMLRLVTDFKVGMEDRERIVRNRDRREIIGALVGIVAFSFIVIKLSFSTATIGALLVVFAYLYMIYKLRSNRKSKHTQKLFLPIKDQLLHQRQFMLNQAKLLDTVWYWMAIPLFIGIMIIFWGLEPNDESQLLTFFSESITSKIVYSIVVAACFAYIVWINKKAVKVNWEPLIKQINTILENLKEEEN